MPENRGNKQTPSELAAEIDAEITGELGEKDSPVSTEDDSVVKGRDELLKHLMAEDLEDEDDGEEDAEDSSDDEDSEEPPTEGDADSDEPEGEDEPEVAQLRATVAALEAKIEALSESKPTEGQQKPPESDQPPELDIPFNLSDEEFDDLTTEREGAEQVLGKKFKTIAQKIQQGVSENVLKRTVTTLVPTIQQMVRYTMAYESFKAANPDLMASPEMAEITGFYVNKVQKEHTQWAPEQVLSEAASRLRKRLKLEGSPKSGDGKDGEDDNPNPPTGKATSTPQRRPKKKKPTGLQAEIDAETKFSLKNPSQGMM